MGPASSAPRKQQASARLRPWKPAFASRANTACPADFCTKQLVEADAKDGWPVMTWSRPTLPVFTCKVWPGEPAAIDYTFPRQLQPGPAGHSSSFKRKGLKSVWYKDCPLHRSLQQKLGSGEELRWLPSQLKKLAAQFCCQASKNIAKVGWLWRAEMHLLGARQTGKPAASVTIKRLPRW